MSIGEVGIRLEPMTPSPALIDPRGPRCNQAVLATGLVIAMVTGAWWLVPVFAVVLLLGAAGGPRYGPVLRFYAAVVRPRLRPPAEMEDPRPPRFAAAVGVAFLAAATLAFAAGAAGVAWGLTAVVAALAGLAAVTGICVGCEVWVWLQRLRAAPEGAAPDLASDGTTWLVFTSAYCTTCGPTVELLRAGDPDTPVRTVDVADRPDLARTLSIWSAPTAVLVDPSGHVRERLVGPDAVRAHLALVPA